MRIVLEAIAIFLGILVMTGLTIAGVILSNTHLVSGIFLAGFGVLLFAITLGYLSLKR